MGMQEMMHHVKDTCMIVLKFSVVFGMKLSIEHTYHTKGIDFRAKYSILSQQHYSNNREPSLIGPVSGLFAYHFIQ